MITLWVLFLGLTGLYAYFSVKLLAALTAGLLAWSGYVLARHWRRGIPLVGAPLVSLGSAGLWCWQGQSLLGEAINHAHYRVLTLLLIVAIYLAASIQAKGDEIAYQIADAGLWLYGLGIVGMVWLRAIGMDDVHVWDVISGRPTYAAAMFVTLLPFGWHLRQRGHRWLFYMFYMFATVWMVDMGLKSRSMLMSLAAMAAFWLLTRSPLARKWRIIGAVLGGIGGSALLGALIHLRPLTVLTRLDMWRAAVDFFIANPLRGVGIGKYYLFGPTGESTRAAVFAHNVPLTIAAEMGLLGLIPLGWLLWTLWRTRSLRPYAANMALVGYGVFCLWNDPLWWWNTTFLVAAIMATTRIAPFAATERQKLKRKEVIV